jgi:hypothetical protein
MLHMSQVMIITFLNLCSVSLFVFCVAVLSVAKHLYRQWQMDEYVSPIFVEHARVSVHGREDHSMKR